MNIQTEALLKDLKRAKAQRTERRMRNGMWCTEAIRQAKINLAQGNLDKHCGYTSRMKANPTLKELGCWLQINRTRWECGEYA